MQNNDNNRLKNILLTVLAVALVALVAWGIWFASTRPNTTSQQPQSPGQQSPRAITDFASCAAAENPINQTDPRTCTADGKTYTEKTDTQKPASMRFTSPKGVVARLDNWTANKTLTNPTTITGQIPGNWSFEGSFPVTLTDADGTVIAQQSAQIQGEWMTSSDVPFTVVLTFTAPTSASSGTLTLKKDNPSGLEENDDSISIPVTFRR